MAIFTIGNMVFGGGDRLGTDQLIGGIQLTMAKAHEWRGAVQAHIFEGDIRRAHDNLRPDLIEAAGLEVGIPPLVLAAILRESTDLELWPTLGPASLTQPI